MTKQISLSQELQISKSTLFDKIETLTNLTDSTVNMYLKILESYMCIYVFSF